MRINVRGKLLGTSAILIAFMVMVGLLAIINLGTVNSLGSSMYADRVLPLEQLGVTSREFMNVRRAVTASLAYIDKVDKVATAQSDIAASEASMKEQMDAYAATYLLDSEKTNLAAYLTDYQTYRTGIDDVLVSVKAHDVATATTKVVALTEVGKRVISELSTLVKINTDEASRLEQQIGSTYDSSRLITFLMLLFAAVIGCALSWFISGRIVKGVTDVQHTLESLSSKCGTWLQEGLGRLADNDLTYAITPVTPAIERYGSDEIGKTAEFTNELRNKVVAAIEAYNEAREGLAGTITEVQ